MAVPRAVRAATAARRAKLVEYRRRKRPYAEFYEELGYASPAAASKDFSRALEESIAARNDSVEVYREEQLLELDYLAEEAHKVLRKQHYVVSAASGKVALDPESGQPLIDDGPKLAAIDRLVKILDRVAKLRGLDAAAKIEGAITVDALDRALTEARRQLAALGPEDPQDAGAERPPS